MASVHCTPHYEYKGYHGCDAFCQLEIAIIAPGNTLVVFIEHPDNNGTSVTNRP